MAEPRRLDTARLRDMAELLRVLAHVERLRMVELLDLQGPMPVHAIVAAMAMPQAAVSGHLNKMRRAGIIAAERRRREMWYALQARAARTLLHCLRGQGAAE